VTAKIQKKNMITSRQKIHGQAMVAQPLPLNTPLKVLDQVKNSLKTYGYYYCINDKRQIKQQ
jgi:hypothetical protein